MRARVCKRRVMQTHTYRLEVLEGELSQELGSVFEGMQLTPRRATRLLRVSSRPSGPSWPSSNAAPTSV